MDRGRIWAPARPLTLAFFSLTLAGALALAGGCSKSHDAGAAATSGAGVAMPAHVTGTPSTEKVIDTLKDAGLHTDGFAILQPIPFGAGYCEQGRVEAIDTLLCEFADDASLDRARRLVQEQWEREGVQTGVATATKRTLVGIADRGHHDPNGKTISQILAALKKI